MISLQCQTEFEGSHIRTERRLSFTVRVSVIGLLNICSISRDETLMSTQIAERSN